jgi:hypothetical protein
MHMISIMVLTANRSSGIWKHVEEVWAPREKKKKT